MQITFTIKREGKDVIALMANDLPAVVIPPLVRALGKTGQLIISRAQQERFTGRGPFPVSENKLGVRTGRLRRSLESTRPVVKGDSVSIAMGSNVVYFAAHEYGSNETVSVAAASVSSYVHPNVFGRGELGILAHKRRSHKRKNNTPARRPLGTAIEEHSLAFLDRFLAEELDKEFNN